MTNYHFIEPLDVLYLRGNRLFAGGGAHGESPMPPWPSVAAGAIRSQMLADAGASLARGVPHQELLTELVNPESFRLTLFSLARRTDAGVEAWFRLPDDIAVWREENRLGLLQLSPIQSSAGLQFGSELPMSLALPTAVPLKPLKGIWISATGLADYLVGKVPDASHLATPEELWKSETRLGIALDNRQRTAEKGRLYTTETVSFACETGLIAGIKSSRVLEGTPTLRLGGDGRGAVAEACSYVPPEPDWERIAQDGRFRVLLTTPGIFPDGWRPWSSAVTNDNPLASARLCSSAVSRQEWVSGWDLVRWAPKKALRSVPAGGVYWYDEFNGRLDDLKRIHSHGLPLPTNAPSWLALRMAEGFNNLVISAWPAEEVEN